MKLRLKYPLEIYVCSREKQKSSLSTYFIRDGNRINIRLIGSDEYEMPEEIQGVKFFRQIEAIEYEIEEIQSDISELSQLISPKPDHIKIINFLKPIINRVLRSLRNWGFLYSIAEIDPSDTSAEYKIRLWNVEYSLDSINWKKVVEPPKGILSTLLNYKDPDDQKEVLNVGNWKGVEEAIQDDIEIPPEREFLANAMHHFKQRNYRVALVEAIICLEIVLSQFLTAYLSITKKVPNKRIKKFLTPQLSLGTKISGLLDLVLVPDDLKQIELENVLKAIGWRNDIVHKKGKLRKDLSEKDIEQKIVSVLSLALILGSKRDHIKNSPMFQQLSTMLADKFKFTQPDILQVRKHEFIIEFDFLEFQLPSDIQQVLNDVATEAKSFLTSHDSRFDPKEHLEIRFMDVLNGLKAQWKNGNVKIY